MAALKPGGQGDRPRRGGRLGGSIGLRLRKGTKEETKGQAFCRFPADGERDAPIPVLRADYFGGCRERDEAMMGRSDDL